MAFYSGKIVKEQTKKKRSILIPLLLFFLILAAGVYYAIFYSPLKDKVAYYMCYIDASIMTTQFGTTPAIYSITIASGDTPLQIGTKLQDKKIIENAADFLCYVRKIDAGAKIQAGYYEIQTPVSIEQLVPMLQSAKIPTARITIPEGLRLDEIAEKIDVAMGKENSIKKFNKDEFLALSTLPENIAKVSFAKGKTTLEGFLYPDTYEIEKNADAQKILDLLITTYTIKVIEATNISTSSSLSPYNIMVLASIIEKESGKNYEEKQVISGILQKRMTNGWLLEVDATFLYEKKDWKGVITAADKATNTPYNTYIRQGLPPTPICNPGLDSIRAALDPKSSDYWFYLHGNDGVIRYGKTYNDHLKNISLYLR